MKKTISTILLSVLSLTFVFTQNIGFEFSSGNNDRQTGVSGIENETGNYIISASVKNGLDKQMVELWELNQQGDIVTSSIISKPDQSLLLYNLLGTPYGYLGIGATYNMDADSSFFWLSKIDQNLILIEDTLIYIGSNPLTLLQCTAYQDTVFCAGSMRDSNLGLPVIPFVAKLSTLGDLLFLKNDFSFSSLLNDIILPKEDSDYYVLNGEYLKVVDTELNLLQVISPAPFAMLQQGDIAPLTDSTFLISGKYFEFMNSNNRQIGIGVSNYQFEEIEMDTFGRKGDTIDYPAYYKSIDYVSKDKIYCGGTSYLQPPIFDTLPSAFVLVQYDSLLNKNWERYYGNDANYNMTGLFATQDGGCLMYGFRHDYNDNPGIIELYILKVNENGEFVTSTTLPVSHADFLIYPNPFSNWINIDISDEFAIKNNLQLELYDMLGKMVLHQKIDNSSISINTGHLIPAVYFCVLKKANGVIIGTKKIIKNK